MHFRFNYYITPNKLITTTFILLIGLRNINLTNLQLKKSQWCEKNNLQNEYREFFKFKMPELLIDFKDTRSAASLLFNDK